MEERDIETLCKMFPGELVEPGMTLVAQQHIFPDRRRADLVFRDAAGRTLVVEIKKTGFHASHLDQVAHYRRMLGGPAVRAMVLVPRKPKESDYALAVAQDIELKWVPVKLIREVASRHHIELRKELDIKIADPAVLADQVKGALITASGFLPPRSGESKQLPPQWLDTAKGVLDFLFGEEFGFLAEYYWPGIAYPPEAPVDWLFFYISKFGHMTSAHHRPAFFHIAYDGESNPQHPRCRLMDHRISKYSLRLNIEHVRAADVFRELLWVEKFAGYRKSLIEGIAFAGEELKRALPQYRLLLYYFKRECPRGQDPQAFLPLPASARQVEAFIEGIGRDLSEVAPWYFDIYAAPDNSAFVSSQRVISEMSSFMRILMPIHQIYERVYDQLYPPRED